MKILLINPPMWNEYGIPLNFNQGTGLTYLGAVLRKSHDVKIIDADALVLAYPQLEYRIAMEKPDIVCVTATTLSYPSMIKTVKIAKAHGAKTIIGGAHVTAMPNESLKETGADVAITGEGEEVIEGIVNRIASVTVPEIVQGISPDLDKLPMPARDLADPTIGSKYYIGNEPRLYKPEAVITAMRGCPHRCFFCSHPIYKLRKTRRRNPVSVVDEIEYLKNTYGIKSIFFYDDEWIGQGEAQNEWIIEVCEEIISRGHNDITYKTQGRCSQKYVTAEVLDAMCKAGFKFIMLGCESGSDEVLRQNRKDLTAEDIRHTVKICHSNGIGVWTFWMVGMPYATSRDEQLTNSLIAELAPYIDHQPQVTICSPIPGSEMWDMYVKNGWISTVDFSRYNQYTITSMAPWQTAAETTGWRQTLINTWRAHR